MKLIFFLVSLSISTAATAKTSSPTQASSPEKTKLQQNIDKVKDAASKAEEIIEEKAAEAKKAIQETATEIKAETILAQANSLSTREASKAGAFAQLSLFDLIVPGKYGFSAYKHYNGKQYEAEYLRGTMSVPLIIADIGSITDQRFTLRIRKFSEASNFNWYWGLTYFAFDAKLGSDLLNSLAPGQTIAEVDLARHRSLGLDLGLGHRWHFKNNVALGVDWVSWSQPLTTLKKDIPFLKSSGSQIAKEKVEKALNIAAYVPRFSIIRLSVGYVF